MHSSEGQWPEILVDVSASIGCRITRFLLTQLCCSSIVKWMYRNAYYHASGNYVVSIYSDFWPVPRGGTPAQIFIYGLRSVLGLRVGLMRRV